MWLARGYAVLDGPSLPIVADELSGAQPLLPLFPLLFPLFLSIILLLLIFSLPATAQRPVCGLSAVSPRPPARGVIPKPSAVPNPPTRQPRAGAEPNDTYVQQLVAGARAAVAEAARALTPPWPRRHETFLWRGPDVQRGALGTGGRHCNSGRTPNPKPYGSAPAAVGLLFHRSAWGPAPWCHHGCQLICRYPIGFGAHWSPIGSKPEGAAGVTCRVPRQRRCPARHAAAAARQRCGSLARAAGTLGPRRAPSHGLLPTLLCRFARGWQIRRASRSAAGPMEARAEQSARCRRSALRRCTGAIPPDPNPTPPNPSQPNPTSINPIQQKLNPNNPNPTQHTPTKPNPTRPGTGSQPPPGLENSTPLCRFAACRLKHVRTPQNPGVQPS